ncbi:MAG: RNA polymerase factor sigma-32 [Candidatus Muproteobacteria bacterium RIFCSPHIGHO2_12_FULL_60_33]|uniref:RNA polymerase sigma factor n=1 Tax=Candidatus Muproteobacteria bacterium RIFCSPLOWO2_01_FULL_60_18 TaxID=1817768 RepID=A0A1F6U475_9PROT|nr:MAG: RNA polymerase factor sigma-32 [Candidatus Muproteobacteria bacterium RIFCSPHIGHO2_01_60_12]OGI52109.1 MAG: RNA polymerase factor sigma-32 [Candidatus Muproteobacteria bacterium RIFCSPLOWO2_01_FULL_60_18]OGI53668.1 MAG: RNA polymerase factor sigma-32 [Candidatus Muproteobacteria bacterium RIFCSPHIGHO2_02_FULL_60_13]OGI55350.1 MAG: RNA polymerase factor sigma-32 [Candidatus Muproteobacteria bacterium RIFCSPHIGHO2_12_FULL_60_33]
MTQALTLPINLYPEKGLSAYLRAVNALPVLSVSEERKLARRYHKHNDLEAARRLVMSNLRNVARIARGFSGYGLPQADLIQEGNIGLMKAVKHYDPARKVRLMSFAVHWIKAEIYDYVLRNWRIVKVATTKSQRKLFFNLRKSRERLGWMTRGEVERLSEKLDVSRETVQEMEGRMSHADVAFDADNDADDDNYHVAPAGYLQDMRYNPEVLATKSDQEDTRQTQLRTALTSLDARSRDIIQRRWLDENKPTLHELADEYGISAERIRQIEMKALDVMKDALEA